MKVDGMRFANFTFDESSGELRRRSVDGEDVRRLPPQPAKLLGHLIRRRPEIVGLEEIRNLLWPDVHVEFEQSLHSCIRKVRAALGESATSPQYVETVPKRGYRFLVEAESTVATVAPPVVAANRPLVAPEGLESETLIPISSSPRALAARPGAARWILCGTLAAILAAIVGLRLSCAVPDGEHKVAVMPFEPIASPSALSPNNDLAESLVAHLVDTGSRSLFVIGPTTTSKHPEATGALHSWMQSMEIDYVINGRETLKNEQPRLLVEIIRGSDGAHVWTRFLDELPSGEASTKVIAKALADELADPRKRR